VFEAVAAEGIERRRIDGDIHDRGLAASKCCLQGIADFLYPLHAETGSIVSVKGVRALFGALTA
jgi:hypothetical protein